MKKFLLSIAFLSFAGLASAQETYSVTVGGTTTNRKSIVGQIELGRQQNNVDVCTKALLPSNCTQAQACVALGVAGGAACTGTDAINAQARIYPNSTVGREGFVVNELIKFRVPIYLLEQIRREQEGFKAWCIAATPVQLDVVCSAAGLPSGCNPCGQ